MVIRSTGRYKLIDDITCRVGGVSGHKLVAGTVLDITQVDTDGHKVISRELGDWKHWDLPVEAVEDAPLNAVEAQP